MDLMDIMMAKAISGGGGGGGGTGGGDVFVVPVAVTLDISGVATFSTAVGVDDVLTALSGGKYVVYVFSMDNGGMTMMLTSYQLAYAASYHIVQINAIDQGDTIGKMTVYHTTDGISETPPAPPG